MEKFDAIIVGAGLSGLTAGIALQKGRKSTLIIEKRKVPGGLCGTAVFNEYEFIIGCNDFGQGLKCLMQELGVPVDFSNVKTKFYFDHGLYQMPIAVRTLMKLLGHPGDLIRIFRALRRAQSQSLTLEQLSQESIRSYEISELLKSLAYPLGVPPARLSLSAIASEFSRENGYGYHKPLVPVGGPMGLVNAMVQQFKKLGGTLLLETPFQSFKQHDDHKEVVAGNQNYQCKYLLNSQGRWREYPATAAPGLYLGMLHLAVDRTLPYPDGVHTIVRLPNNISEWMNHIDRGVLPQRFGFNLFPYFPESKKYYSINIYFLLPRGRHEPDEELNKKILEYLLDETDKLLPGLKNSILFQKIVSPAEYEKLHGLSSQISIHAGAAVLSAKAAASHVLRKSQNENL